MSPDYFLLFLEPHFPVARCWHGSLQPGVQERVPSGGPGSGQGEPEEGMQGTVNNLQGEASTKSCRLDFLLTQEGGSGGSLMWLRGTEEGGCLLSWVPQSSFTPLLKSFFPSGFKITYSEGGDNGGKLGSFLSSPSSLSPSGLLPSMASKPPGFMLPEPCLRVCITQPCVSFPRHMISSHIFTQQRVIEHLLCTRHWANSTEQNGEESNHEACASGVYGLPGDGQ